MTETTQITVVGFEGGFRWWEHTADDEEGPHDDVREKNASAERFLHSVFLHYDGRPISVCIGGTERDAIKSILAICDKKTEVVGDVILAADGRWHRVTSSLLKLIRVANLVTVTEAPAPCKYLNSWTTKVIGKGYDFVVEVGVGSYSYWSGNKAPSDEYRDVGVCIRDPRASRSTLHAVFDFLTEHPAGSVAFVKIHPSCRHRLNPHSKVVKGWKIENGVYVDSEGDMEDSDLYIAIHDLIRARKAKMLFLVD